MAGSRYLRIIWARRLLARSAGSSLRRYPRRYSSRMPTRDVLAELTLEGVASMDAERMLAGTEARRFTITAAGGGAMGTRQR
jgi:hypothetical protein